MNIENQIIIVLYVILGATATMLYALRRIFLLEKKILRLERVLIDFDRKLERMMRRR